MKKVLLVSLLAVASFLGSSSARADQINLHATACVAYGNGMNNIYPQVNQVAGLNSQATLLCPIPISPTNAAKVLYVDGKNLTISNPRPTQCTVSRLSWSGTLLGTLSQTAPAASGAWELAFSLSGTMQPGTWDYFVMECSVNTTIYGGMLGYTITN